MKWEKQQFIYQLQDCVSWLTRPMQQTYCNLRQFWCQIWKKMMKRVCLFVCLLACFYFGLVLLLIVIFHKYYKVKATSNRKKRFCFSSRVNSEFFLILLKSLFFILTTEKCRLKSQIRIIANLSQKSDPSFSRDISVNQGESWSFIFATTIQEAESLSRNVGMCFSDISITCLCWRLTVTQFDPKERLPAKKML